MSPTFYHIVHVFSVLILTGYTFYAFGNPAPEGRRTVLMMTGIASLLILITGFGLIAKMGYSMTQLWIGLKIVVWLALSAIAGIAYRRRQIVKLLTVIASALLLVALYAVYVKPV